MTIQITISVVGRKECIDISVNTKQRISTTIGVLKEKYREIEELKRITEVRVGENKEKVKLDSTYEQAKVLSGDIVYLYSDDIEEENSIEHFEMSEQHRFNKEKREEYMKSSFTANNILEFEMLTRHSEGLLDCECFCEGENVIFTYDMYEKKTFNDIYKEDLEDKYSFLVNFPFLLQAARKYDIDFSSGNIFYDENLVPYAKKRDIKTEDIGDVDVYKALIAAVFEERHNIEDFLSGTEIVENEKWFLPYKGINSVNEIREKIKEIRQEYICKQKKTKKLVSKRGNIVKNILAVSMSVLAVVMLGLYIYQGVYVGELLKAKDAGERKYLRKEYVGCIDALNDISIDRMDYETKYILAMSYAKTENLNREEITNIVDRLSLTSSEREFDFWIYLGRQNYDEAIDAAKYIMDDRLLVYAYMSEYNYLEKDTEISGEEKETRMSEIKKQIEQLGKKYSVQEEQ